MIGCLWDELRLMYIKPPLNVMEVCGVSPSSSLLHMEGGHQPKGDAVMDARWELAIVTTKRKRKREQGK
jgi:hypothetical protein